MPSERPNKSLWSGPSDTGHTRDWLEPEAEPTQQYPSAAEQSAAQAPPPVATPKTSRRGPVLGIMAATIVALGGVVAGQQLAAGKTDTETAVVLPPAVGGNAGTTDAGKIYAATNQGVVQIKTGDASGTGFVIDAQGTIVTNAHVVEGASTVQVDFNDSNKGVEGKVLGKDVSSDLAVIRVNPAEAGKLVPLTLADSDKVKTGDQVLAIGYPLGLSRTATEGIVSGIGRQIKAQNGFSIDKVIQTDASINPGNSGGPLLDSRGRVIGVNSQIAATGGGGNTGIGFAIPSNTVRSIVPSLAAGTTVAHPYLGLQLVPVANTSGGLGAQVADLTPGGPGERAGLKGGQDGDVITALDGVEVDSPDALIAELSGKKVGDKVTLTVQRGGEQKQVSATVGDRPASSQSATDQSATPTTPQQQTPVDPSDPNSQIPTPSIP
jgi:putative serine protease PepD